jgi:hypothetical protein
MNTLPEGTLPPPLVVTLTLCQTGTEPFETLIDF